MGGHVLLALFPKKPAKPIFHALRTKRSPKCLPKEISWGALYGSLEIQNLPSLPLSINLGIQRNLRKKLTRMRSQIWSQIGHKFDPSPRVYTMYKRVSSAKASTCFINLTNIHGVCKSVSLVSWRWRRCGIWRRHNHELFVSFLTNFKFCESSH